MNAASEGTPAAVVIGAGPAGLTAAYELTRAGTRPVVIERGIRVGGLARTEEYRGFRFDIGGHRFFTKVKAVEAMWHEVLGDDFVRRPRLSRIYYRGRFFAYPLRPLGTLGALGVVESAVVVASYLRWQLRPHPREETFEEWVTNRFGRRLFETFFRTYTEKVWGVSCAELRAEWAAQRIKDLSLRTALASMLARPRTTITTLIEEFHYPRLGPGMMWDGVRDAVERGGGTVQLASEVVAIRHAGDHVTDVVVRRDGAASSVPGTHFVSTMPLTDLVARLDPPPPDDVRTAARALRYRDFVTVCLIVRRPDLFPDNWIYVHDGSVRVGRIQNFKNWSPDMVPDRAKTALGLEYFCNEGDALWETADAALVDLAAREIATLGLARQEDVEDGCVVRVPKAYPLYDPRYRDHLARVRGFLERFANLQTIGRNGLHRYDNQDHAMVTGMVAARNILHGERNDVWNVNTEQAYHEELREPAGGLPAHAIVPGFAKLDRLALGVALGIVCGIGLAGATLFLVAKGGPHVGQNLRLLAQFLPGYRVSAWGSAIGLLYGLVGGFGIGFSFAALRNAAALLFVVLVRRRLEARALGRLLDYL